MDKNATKRLILTMRDSGKLLPETVEEMNDYLEELEEGPLDKMDTDYLEGLASRLGFAKGGGRPASADASADTSDADEDEDDEDFESEWADDLEDADDEALAEATERIEALEAQVAAAQTAVGRARDLYAEITGAANRSDGAEPDE